MGVDLGGGVTLLTRAETGVTFARRSRMPLPVDEDWLHHSVTNPTGNPAADFRTLDGIGISRGHRGVSYSYMIHPDGTVGEGQGDHVGAHTLDHNSRAYGVVLIGNYEELQPTAAQLHSYRALRDWRIRTGRLRPGTYPTGGHRDTGFSTACPGTNAWRRLGQFRAGASAPKPEPPPIPGDLDMPGIFSDGMTHAFYVRPDGRFCENYGKPDGPRKVNDSIFPAGWRFASGDKADVTVIDHAPGTDHFGYTVTALREDGQHVNVAVWQGAKGWKIQGAPS